MPYQSRKVRGKNCYKVFKNVNKKTRKGTLRKTQRVFAKCATAENAKKQMNLLRAIENNKNFVPNSARKSKK
jgi:hypothetical protein